MLISVIPKPLNSSAFINTFLKKMCIEDNERDTLQRSEDNRILCLLTSKTTGKDAENL